MNLHFAGNSSLHFKKSSRCLACNIFRKSPINLYGALYFFSEIYSGLFRIFCLEYDFSWVLLTNSLDVSPKNPHRISQQGLKSSEKHVGKTPPRSHHKFTYTNFVVKKNLEIVHQCQLHFCMIFTGKYSFATFTINSINLQLEAGLKILVKKITIW